MGTLAQLKAEIADDLHRSDLTTRIGTAIKSSIRKYQQERWWWLEEVVDFTASASQSYYDVPSDFLDTDSLLVTVSSSKYELSPRTYRQIDALDGGIFSSTPDIYAFYKNQFRIYPPPNGNYVFTLSYHKELAELTDGASNAWTTEAKDLIKYDAENEIYMNHLKSQEMGAIARGSRKEAYDYLNSQNTKKASTRRIRRVNF